MFGYGVDTTVPKGKWNSIRVEFKDQYRRPESPLKPGRSSMLPKMRTEEL
jgi:hypothetical protein